MQIDLQNTSSGIGQTHQINHQFDQTQSSGTTFQLDYECLLDASNTSATQQELQEALYDSGNRQKTNGLINNYSQSYSKQSGIVLEQTNMNKLVQTPSKQYNEHEQQFMNTLQTTLPSDDFNSSQNFPNRLSEIGRQLSLNSQVQQTNPIKNTFGIGPSHIGSKQISRLDRGITSNSKNINEEGSFMRPDKKNAQIDKFHSAQEISQEIIHSYNTRKTCDPRMLSNSHNQTMQFGRLTLFKDKFLKGKSKKQANERSILLADMLQLKSFDEDDQSTNPYAQRQMMEGGEPLVNHYPTQFNDQGVIDPEGRNSMYGGEGKGELSIDAIFPQAVEQQEQLDQYESESMQSMEVVQKLGMEGSVEIMNESTSFNRSFCQKITDFIKWLFYPLTLVLYYSLCCCLCSKGNKNKDQRSLRSKHSAFGLMAKLKKHLKLKKQSEVLITITAMVQLLRKSPKAIESLRKIRINPQLNRMHQSLQGIDKQQLGKHHSTKLRSDLEFYLPQIISHYLRQDLTPQQQREIKLFIIRVSEMNIFFAHKVWFNLRASLVNKDNQKQIVQKIMSLQSEIEVMATRHSENLYLAYSDNLIKLITKSNLPLILDPECQINLQKDQNLKEQSSSKQDASRPSVSYFLNYFRPQEQSSTAANNIPSGGQLLNESPGKQQLLQNYRNQQQITQFNPSGVDQQKSQTYNQRNQRNDQPLLSLGGDENQQLLNIDDETINDAIINDFGIKLTPYRSIMSKQSQPLDQCYKEKAFFSTPYFVNDLTDICVKVLKKSNKIQYLQEQLQKINQNLPATAYVPILNKFHRNYMVLNILEQESRLFITAEKAPFLICIEVFQPMELELMTQKQHAKHRPRAFEILKRFNIINKDSNKLIQKINYQLSKPVFVVDPKEQQVIKAQQQIQSASQIQGLPLPTLKNDSNDLFANIGNYQQQQNYTPRMSIGISKTCYNSKDETRDSPDKQSFDIENQSNNNVKNNSNFIDVQFNIPQGFGNKEKQRLEDQIEERMSVNLARYMQDQEEAKVSQINGRLADGDLLGNNDHENLISFEEGDQISPNAMSKGAMQNEEDHSSHVNEHYGFYQNQERITEKNEFSERKSNMSKIILNASNTGQLTQPISDYDEFLRIPGSSIQKQSSQQINLNAINRNTFDQFNQLGGNQKNNYQGQQATQNHDHNDEQITENLNTQGQGSTQIQGQGDQISVSVGPEMGIKDTVISQTQYDEDMSAQINQSKQFKDLGQKIFGNYETAKQQEERLRMASQYGHFKTWRLVRMIVKSGDDLRSEQFAMQLIETMDLIFKKRKLKLKLCPYEILSTGKDCGIVEFIPDAFSIDYIKKKMSEKAGRDMDLVDFYQIKFGEPKSKTYRRAIKNLADSLAAYSLVCYILQIKDRHNGNILINQNDGSLVHIDFGFILASRLLNFETAPFKITGDIIRLLGGLDGEGFKRFRERMIEGFIALHEDNEKLIILVKMLAESQGDLPCFKRGANQAINELSQRLTPLGPQVRLDRAACAFEVDKIIRDAYKSWSTIVYDRYQYCCQGIF